MPGLFTKKIQINTNQNPQSLLMVFGLLLLVCIGFRIWFWYTTHLTLEDALITFRYADNVASGNGFVYNSNERVLGTTTPLWTLMLAGAKFVGADLFSASKVLGILFDLITCLLIIIILFPLGVRIAVLSSLLFAASPAIIPVTISGMETSLLLCSMSVTLLGYARKNLFFGIGLALTILTRIDGVLYATVLAGMSIMRDWKWTLYQIAIACLCCLPWYIFSFTYFGSILPQSFIAKRAVYHLDLSTSAAPFISTFTPFLDSNPIKILIKSVILISIGTGIMLLFKLKSVIFPAGVFILLYSALLMFSRIVIFVWYLIPPIFFSYIFLAVAVDWYIVKIKDNISNKIINKFIFPLLIFAIFLSNIVLVREKIEYYSQLQEFEKDVREKIGLWLKDNAKPGSKIFLEPIGYIGYFAGLELYIQDEIGLVTPIAARYRNSDANWYTKTIIALKPDYIVQYTAALKNNKAEGTQTPLFNNDKERIWFFSNYFVITTVKATGIYPQITQKEKEYTIFKRVDTT